ncbi:hypothetical protein [uncultured Rothia sp.]|uniref:hypothetical protein n=1 Tax=uncultured Rothia sp. TaxID=316088 RepID=UPI00288AECEF|nr:hypothetical protein [uncultured Rothia sp.]
MFNLSHRRTEGGLIPRLEFDAVLALDFAPANEWTWICYSPKWSLLPVEYPACDAMESIIDGLDYDTGGTHKLEDFDLDTILACETQDRDALQEFIDDFGVFEDYPGEPPLVVGIYPYNDIEGTDFWKECAAAITSSRELRQAIEGGIEPKLNESFNDSGRWHVELGDRIPAEDEPLNCAPDELFFAVKIYREYPVVKP